ncbi:unnamed protein product, partial [marine sediment metagenome]
MLTLICIMQSLFGMGHKTYYDVMGAAAYAGVSRPAIDYWIRKGVKDVNGKKIWLPARIVDGETQINEIDFELYLDALGYQDEESGEDES